MEFNEKLRQLRKSKGLTQDRLAEKLYVSRTAVSKWESGRGYPNIDSLKRISELFGVTVDDLLSGDRLLSIAETEARQAVTYIYRLLSAVADLLAVVLVVLPLYPDRADSFVYAVTLAHYTDVTPVNKAVYLVLYISLIAAGIARIFTLKKDKTYRMFTVFSVAMSSVAVLILAFAREAYAVAVVFSLLAAKAFLIVKDIQSSVKRSQ